MNPALWSYLLSAVGVLGLFLAGKAKRLGWAVGFSAQGLWIAYATATHQFGFYISAAAYGSVYALNWWRWRKAHLTEPTPDPDPVDTTWLDAGIAPETAIAKVTNMVQVEGDTAYLPNGQVLQGIHADTSCEGRGCPIHHPRSHHMVNYPLLWRGDKNIMERTCPHGVGHDDPDDVAWRLQQWHNVDHAIGVHGCDGCCLPKAA